VKVVVTSAPGWTRTTSASPGVPAGVVKATDPADAVTPVAATPPTSTCVTAPRRVPVTVTSVPPACGPCAGVTAVTVEAT
jgi:hypothetical protein